MKLGPKRIIRTQLESYVGSFGDSTRVMIDDKSRWKINGFYHCRETFQKRFLQTTENIIFRCTEARRLPMAQLVWKVEDILGVKHHTRIGPTQRNDHTWLHVAPFWLEQLMRRSFFTAMVRAGNLYTNPLNDLSEVKKALYTTNYFGQTKIAVERFLEGYTTYTGNAIGWQLAFEKRTSKEIELLLVKP